MPDEIYANDFLDCSTEKKEGHIVKYIKASTAENQIVDMMGKLGFATGHGSSIADLLTELEWQVNELILKHKGE